MEKSSIVAIVALAVIGIGASGYEYYKSHQVINPEVEDAVKITDISKIDESLVGKYVSISGTPEMTSGVCDPDLGIQFDYPVVYRYSYVLEESGDADGQPVEWQEKSNWEEGDMGTEVWTGEVKIGAYTIDGWIVCMCEESADSLVTEELAEQTGWTYCSDPLLTENTDWSSPFSTDNLVLDGNWLLSKPFTDPENMQNPEDQGMMKITYYAGTLKKHALVIGLLGEDGHITEIQEICA